MRLVQASLAAAGAARLAYGELQHLAWQAETFGFHLASLEVRQHAAVHAQALAELAPGAAGDAAALDRLATRGWGPAPAGVGEATREVLDTLRVMAELQARYGPEACRRYVVSFSRCAAAAAMYSVPWVVDGVWVQVGDIDEHFEGAKAAGARLLSEIEDGPVGRLYRVEDHEGHRWMFAQEQ